MENRKRVLDTIPSDILHYNLSDNLKIWIYFLISPTFQCAVYMFDLASCIAVVNEHYSAGYYVWGTFTLLLMYFPSGIFFMTIISRPDLWNQQDGIPGSFKWFGYRISQFLFYPIWVMYRYAKQIFWGLEALMFQDDEDCEKALEIANQASHTELYLFLQAYLQAIPQALLQLCIMLAHYQQNKKISQMQTFCVASSVMLIAQKSANFLWFESNKILGRIEPWIPRKPEILKNELSNENTNKTNKTVEKLIRDVEALMPFLKPKVPSSVENPTQDIKPQENDNVNNQPIDMDQSISLPNEMAPPRPSTYPRDDAQSNNMDYIYNDSEATRPMSNPETRNVTSNEDYITSQMPVLSRPDSKNIELPTRKLRLEGREEDDALGKVVIFFWWFFFVLSRLLALASCAIFQPFVVIGVFLIHYIIIMSHLIRRNGFPSIYKVFIQLCLGYVYTFCFIEFRYKIKNIFISYIFYFTIITIENVVLSISWYIYNDEAEGFWYSFIFIIIFGSKAIGFLSMALYFSILMPKVKVILS